MSSTNHSGLEARYLNRFSGLRPQTGAALKNYDSASNVAEHLTLARASVKTQERNIGNLFATAEELVAGINTTQQMLGRTFVKNMPQPTAEIRDSPSKQLGYVQLSMRFFQAGVMHFMEEMAEADQRIEHLEKLSATLAEYDVDADLIGEMVSLDLDSLDKGGKPSSDVTVAPKPITPPATPTRSVTSEKVKADTKLKGKK